MDKENQNLTELVIDTQNGVEGAFEKLYHESFRHAYCTASLLLKNEQDIEDVLQNSYMYVAKYIKDLKNPESFNNWLSVIVKHECQKYLSKQKRVSDIFVAVKKTKEFELIDENNLPVDYIEKSETRDVIQRIVDDLPPDKRACIVLFYYEQHSLAEISEILGVPEGTVMSRLYYARKKLEKEFRKLQKKDETLFGISVIPLIVSLFAYQAKTAIIPTAIESSVIAAVTSAGCTASVAASSVAGTAAATASSASASVAAGTAGGAVAAKVTAIAVAATVAVGGGIATVNHINSTKENVTTQAISTSATEEHATVAAVIFEETSATDTTITTTYISTKPVFSSTVSTTELTVSMQISTANSSAVTSTIANSTTKPVTTRAATTSKPTTTVPTTAKPTTTQKETATEAVTDASDVFSVSNCVLSEYTGSESNVSIPSTVGSSAVTAIGTGAFAGNTDITSVSMPSTVTRIGMEAFSDCTNLRSVSLPSSLNSIGVASFYGCSSLTSVTVPDGTQTISDEAFSYCTNLSTITIPDSVTSISEDAFYGSDNVTIRCSEGSVAYDYAIANSIDFELI